MRIIIDAMGGDNAPEAPIRGALRAVEELGVDVTLVGRREDIEKELSAAGAQGKVEIVDARQVITMEDDPSTATRHKKDSSMTVALTLLRDGAGDAVVSAGSTGALLTGATLIVKRIRGIRRAALAPVLPNGGRGVLLIDCGANVDCTAEYLLQFAFMGSFYAQRVMGCTTPRVGLLNNGTEETKGGDLQAEAFARLREASELGRIHFIGNVEASSVLSGDVDVVVTDGFSGNILLKGFEGAAKFMIDNLKTVLTTGIKNKVAALLVKNDLKAFKALLDPNRIGGTALMGITKPVIKAHGSSNADAILSAVRQAVSCSDSGITAEIESNIEYMKLPVEKAKSTEE